VETNNGYTTSLERADGSVVVANNVVFPRLFAAGLTAGTYYVRITGSISTVPLYWIRATLGPAAEVEPNNNAGQAIPIGTSTASGPAPEILGYVATGDPDVYTFTLDTPLGPDESVVARLNNIATTTSIRMQLYDGADPATAPSLGYDSNFVNWVPTGLTGTGPFAVQVTVTSTAGIPYSLSIERGERAEHEPNGTQGTALALGALPATLMGSADRNDTDVYAVTFDADLGASEALRVSVANLPDGSPFVVRLLAPDFTTELGRADLVNVTLTSATALTAGTYYVTVGQATGSSSTTTTDHYRLSAEVVDVQ
jgi:hypothetical protein